MGRVALRVTCYANMPALPLALPTDFRVADLAHKLREEEEEGAQGITIEFYLQLCPQTGSKREGILLRARSSLRSVPIWVSPQIKLCN